MRKNSTLLAQKDLLLAFLDSQPDIATKTIEQLHPTEVAVFIKNIPLNYAALLFTKMLPYTVAKTCEFLNIKLVGKIFNEIEAYRVSAIARFIEKKLLRKILLQLKKPQYQEVIKALNYSTNTVGAWMMTPVLTVRNNNTMREAYDIVKDNSNSNYIDYVFVVDHKESLCGLLHISNIFTENAEKKIHELLNDELHYVYSHETLESIKYHLGWMQHDNLPVVTKNLKLVGVIRHVDLRRGLGQHISEISLDDNDEATNILYDVFKKCMALLFDSFGSILRNK